MARRYGRIPATVKDDLPRWVEILRNLGIRRPYAVVGEMLGVTEHRIQQVVVEAQKAKRISVSSDVAGSASSRKGQKAQRYKEDRIDWDSANDVFEEED